MSGRCQWQPLALKLTEGQAYDGPAAADLLTSQKDQILLADRAYDSDALRQTLAERGAWANIKPTSRRVKIPAFSGWFYRYRNCVERFFNKLKLSRGDCHPLREARCQLTALVKLAAARIWMRFMCR
jgi:transposase